jgi:hypothetical protein
MREDEIRRLAQLIVSELRPMLTARWLKLKEASAYSSIDKTRLKKLAKDRIIKGYQDSDSKRGDWIFDKHSIDEYRKMPYLEIELKAKKILRSLDLNLPIFPRR